MIATLTVDGFGRSPDKAIADLERRCSNRASLGWGAPTEVHVQRGRDPSAYSECWGYIATTTLMKEVSS